MVIRSKDFPSDKELLGVRPQVTPTRGLCFLPEDYRIQAIEFIQSHTRPDQTLFVGVTRHDKIVANDNLTYFATHRLPATRWSHFDPDLQTSAEIQKANRERTRDKSSSLYYFGFGI